MEEFPVYAITFIITGLGAYFGTYLREKGKNTATREDVQEITQKVEEVKAEYHKDLETLKHTLSLNAERQSLFFKERVRVFERVKDHLVNLKLYCVLSKGSLGYGGEFHPNLESHSGKIKGSGLTFVTELRIIIEEEKVYLTKTSYDALENLVSRGVSMLPSMELALMGAEDDFRESAINHYTQVVQTIDECLLILFKDIDS